MTRLTILRSILAAAAALVLTAPDCLFAQQLDPIAKRFTRSEAMIAMRDGVKLYTTIYRPKDATGELPFILLRTPYGIDTRGPTALNAYLKDLAEEGYI